MDRVLSIALGVVIAHEKIDHPWQEYAWRPVSVFLGAPEIEDWRELRRDATATHYHAATLAAGAASPRRPSAMRPISTAGAPLVYVVLREGGDSGKPIDVAVVTASPYDAEVYGYDGSEIVGTVAMPEPLIELLRGVRGRASRRGAVRQAPAPEAPPGRGAQVRPGADRRAAPAQGPAGSSAMNDEEPFLKRWSRRKTRPRRGRPMRPIPSLRWTADVRALDDRSRPEETPPASGDKPQEQARADRGRLRRRRFRGARLQFRLRAVHGAGGAREPSRTRRCRSCGPRDAVFTTPDPFQDYLGDYTDAAVAVPPGTLKTAYRIGKGFLTDEEVAEWEKLGQAGGD